MLKVGNVKLSEGGKKITYSYELTSATAKYFNKNDSFFVEYSQDVSAAPRSILIIPLLANILPISWFAGFDVQVDEIDADFAASAEEIRAELGKHYPHIQKVQSKLIAGTHFKNQISAASSAMLFSGGVDAFATYFRNFEKRPALVTIHGADIELSDQEQWNEVRQFNENEPMLCENQKHYIKANLRTFYTYQVDLLLENLSWWGNIQHGLALIGVVAPLSFAAGYCTIYIASTRSVHMEFNPWGSMPEIDEKISWAASRTIHDGFELKRQDKVDTIVSAVQKLGKQTTIRVCYSDLKNSLNCSRCEKCVRTIFGIILAGGNPSQFGFVADPSVYDLAIKILGRGFKSRGTQFFWSELLEKGRNSENFFVFSNRESEKAQIEKVLSLVEANQGSELVKPSGLKKIKHVLIHKYPKLFSYYLKVRRAFL